MMSTVLSASGSRIRKYQRPAFARVCESRVVVRLSAVARAVSGNECFSRMANPVELPVRRFLGWGPRTTANYARGADVADDSGVTAPPELPVVARLVGLAPARRATVALLLAEVVLPLGDLAPLTPEPLSALADSIRGDRRSDVEEARTTLRAIPRTAAGR
jgi:hypothetical protein